MFIIISGQLEVLPYITGTSKYICIYYYTIITYYNIYVYLILYVTYYVLSLSLISYYLLSLMIRLIIICLLHPLLHTLLHTALHPLLHTALHPLLHTVLHPLLHTVLHLLLHTVLHPLLHTLLHYLLHTLLHPLLHTTYNLTIICSNCLPEDLRRVVANCLQFWLTVNVTEEDTDPNSLETSSAARESLLRSTVLTYKGGMGRINQDLFSCLKEKASIIEPGKEYCHILLKY
jgi:hypothetical protein